MSVSKLVKKVSAVGVLGLVGLLGSDNAEAAIYQGDTATLAVEVTVDANCSIGSSGTLLFTPYDFSPSATYGSTATATVTANCSDGVDWTIFFDGGVRGNSTMIGVTAAGVLSPLHPGNVGELLTYAVSDVALGGAPVTSITGTGTGAVQSTDLYGTIAPNLAPTDGVYQDTISMDLWY